VHSVAGNVDNGPVVDLEYFSGLLIVDRFEFPVETVASIVDDDVDAAEFVDGGCESCGNGVG